MTAVVHEFPPPPESDPWDGKPLFLQTQTAEVTPLRPPEGPVLMADSWDEEEPLIVPELLPVEGGLALFYAGESHMIFGPGGVGKSWVSQFAAAAVARAGGLVLLVDYESNQKMLKERLKSLGVTKEEAGRIAYWRISGSLMPGSPTAVQFWQWVDSFGPTFVVIDSVAKALGAAGLDENSNSEFIKWTTAVLSPLEQRDVTSLVIDHTGHEKELGGSSKQQARGASAKVQQMSGASYQFKPVKPWTRTSPGEAELISKKDRGGHRLMDGVAAVIHVNPSDEGRHVDMRSVAPDPTAASTGRSYSLYMEKVSEVLEQSGVPMSQYAAQKAMPRNFTSKDYFSKAVGELAAIGAVKLEEGKTRNSKMLVLVQPFRDPNAEAPTAVRLGEVDAA